MDVEHEDHTPVAHPGWNRLEEVVVAVLLTLLILGAMAVLAGWLWIREVERISPVGVLVARKLGWNPFSRVR